MNGWISKIKTPVVYWFLLFAVVFWVSMLYVFYPVLPLDWVMLSPDFPKYYPTWARTQHLEILLTGKDGVAPYTFLLFMLPPLARQELFFMLTSFFAAISIFYYLRTQKLSRLAAYGGGLLFAFSGYSFTLFCAGHCGYFMLISCGLFAFGLINRCFQTRQLFYFVMLGATVIWSEIHQPDIWLLCVFLIAAYGIWRSILEWRTQHNWSFLWRVYPRFILTVITILLIGSLQIKLALTDSLASREKQFSETSAIVAGDNPTNAAQVMAQKKFERWIFSTNWSLPPEDMLEFVVPGVFGNHSFQMPYPYWGRLGQPYVFQPGKMMPNYRQHTVYLGIVSVLLMLFAAWCWVTTRKKFSANCPLPPANSPSLTAYAPTPDYSDVPFWLGAWVICLVISMGRYTPVYQVIYHCFPFMDYLRAPVKCYHLVEIANAFLAAYGIEYFIRTDSLANATKKRFAYFCVGCAVLLLMGFAFVQLKAVVIEQHITGLGFGQLAVTLREYAASNLVRSTFLAGVVSVIFFAASRARVSMKVLVFLASSVVIFSTFDLAVVARRYTIPVNVGPHHVVNPVIKAMLTRTGGKPANVINYATSNAGEQDWFSMALDLNGFANMVPKPDNKPISELYNRFQNTPVQFWHLAGVRFVLLPRKAIEPFIRQRILSVVCDFEIGTKTVRCVQPSNTSFVLAEVVAFPVLPALYFDWDGPVPADKQIAHVLKEDKIGQLVADVAPVVNMRTNVFSQSIVFDTMRKMPYALSTQGYVEAASSGLLVFNEPFSSELESFVDGKSTQVFQANGLWAAIQVPQGKHQIMLRQRRAWGFNAVSLFTGVLVLGWGLIRLRRCSLPND